jgi:hypothetical protein
MDAAKPVIENNPATKLEISTEVITEYIAIKIK